MFPEKGTRKAKAPGFEVHIPDSEEEDAKAEATV